MASQKLNYFSFLFVAIIASLFRYSIAQEQVDYCKAARDNDLCKTMVVGSTNWLNAFENAMKATLSLAKDLQSKSDLIAPALVSLQSEKRDSVQKTCKESFETVIDMLTEAQTALAIGDNGTVHTKLSAALDTDCVDELSNAGATSPVANMANELNGKIAVCLAIFSQNVKS